MIHPITAIFKYPFATSLKHQSVHPPALTRAQTHTHILLVFVVKHERRASRSGTDYTQGHRLTFFPVFLQSRCSGILLAN